MLRVVFDAGPLITSCKFSVRGRLILDFVLDGCSVTIPSAVCAEVMRAPARFEDAREAKQRVDMGKLQVAMPQPDSNMQAILDLYGLGEGEQQSILLMHQQEFASLVVDDHLAYLVADRLHVPKRFFLDLIVSLQQAGHWMQLTQRLLYKPYIHGIRPHLWSIHSECWAKGDGR